MATTKLVVNAMYSGQGMCNVVEAYDGTTLTKLMLVDFGAEKDSATVRSYTLPILVNKIKAHGKIDVMVISHSDRDHWNLMNELLEALDSTITIDIAAFGIGAWFNAALKFQKAVVARLPVDKNGLTPGLKYFFAATSDINDVGLDLWDIGWDGVRFNILAASVTSSASALVSDEPNTASIVLRCKFADNYSIFTGDATAATLKFINKKMNGRSYLGTGFLVTAPHHGALATLDYELGDLETFTASCEPQNALASAQLRSRYNHPNVCVMCTLAKDAGKNSFSGGPHSVVLHFPGDDFCAADPIYKVLNNLPWTIARVGYYWYEIETDYNIFTTITSGAVGVHWIFTTNSNGSTSVTQGALAFDILREQVIPAPHAAPRDATEFYVGGPPPRPRAPSPAEAPAPPRVALPVIPELEPARREPAW